MAVQNPFFGKREPEPFQRHTTPANGLNTLTSAPPSGGRASGRPHGAEATGLFGGR